MMKFKGNLLLTDPVYIVKKWCESDWKLLLSDGYDYAVLHYLGITKYVLGEIGEDSEWNVIDNSGMKVGSYCSDSRLFCVCDLKQVLVYNPDFLISFDKNSECYCVINDFDREIKVIPDEKHNNHVIGIGNNCFKTQCR